jgi:hypothetical protein
MLVFLVSWQRPDAVRTAEQSGGALTNPLEQGRGASYPALRLRLLKGRPLHRGQRASKPVESPIDPLGVTSKTNRRFQSIRLNQCTHNIGGRS